MALGLLKTKPAVKSSSTQSIVDPTRYRIDPPSTNSVPPGVSIRLLRLIARCWSEQPEHRPEFGTLEVELQGVVNELLDEEGRAVAKASTQE